MDQTSSTVHTLWDLVLFDDFCLHRFLEKRQLHRSTFQLPSFSQICSSQDHQRGTYDFSIQSPTLFVSFDNGACCMEVVRLLCDGWTLCIPGLKEKVLWKVRMSNASFSMLAARVRLGLLPLRLPLHGHRSSHACNTRASPDGAVSASLCTATGCCQAEGRTKRSGGLRILGYDPRSASRLRSYQVYSLVTCAFVMLIRTKPHALYDTSFPVPR